MRRGVPRSGEVTVRLLHTATSSSADDDSTQARIVRGRFVEPLDVIVARLGVSSSSPPLQLVDAHGLCVDGALTAGAVYYLDGQGDDSVHTTTTTPRDDTCDACVWWAYDARMARLHAPRDDARTPETPYRLQRAMQALRACPRAHALLPRELCEGSNTTTTRARLLPARLATREEVLAWHDAATYGDFVSDRAVPLPPSALPSDVYCTDTSSTAARLAAGAVIDAARAVWHGVQCARRGQQGDDDDNALLALCLVRPPGHHCMRDAPAGFCLLNNVALAAQALRTSGAVAVPRIAIVDLDVHFGDGTARDVEDVARGASGDAPSCLYMSLHRYDAGSFYPRDARAATAYTGVAHCLCNVAVDTHAHDAARCTAVISDHLLDRVTTRVIVPVLTRFAPDVVLVSLGLDAAYGDPLGKQAVEGGYARAMRTLKRWCLHDAPRAPVGLVAALEGGYHAAALAECVCGVAHALALRGDDADVRRYCALHTPQTWRDVRARQWRDVRARQRRDASSDNAADDDTCLADDATLLQQHLRWCDDVVDEARRVHGIV